MQNANISPQMGIPERNELLHLVQLYEAGVVHSMPADTLQQTGYGSEHELVTAVLNAVSLQSTHAIWNRYGMHLVKTESNTKNQGGTS